MVCRSGQTAERDWRQALSGRFHGGGCVGVAGLYRGHHGPLRLWPQVWRSLLRAPMSGTHRAGARRAELPRGSDSVQGAPRHAAVPRWWVASRSNPQQCQGERVGRAQCGWTRSRGASHYLVSLRRYAESRLRDYQGWFVSVEGTSISGDVPRQAIQDALEPLTLDVAAIDKNLFSYMTTGNGGGAFAVPPVQKVEGGFGVVGSMLLRSYQVDSPIPPRLHVPGRP